MLRVPVLSLAVLLVLLAGTARAQTLQGLVTDAETGEPLPGATVSVPALRVGALTDAAGHYRLDVPASGPARVVFRFVGYAEESRTVTVGAAATTLDVALAPSFIEASTVTVTARARESDVLSTPQSVAVVDAQALARNGAGTPFEALDEVAGVRLLRTGPAVAKPVVRGLTAQRVLVVADGVRQEGQGWGDEHGPEVGAADVDRIEVVRGPSSLLYGSDALGGVVQTTRADLFAAPSPLGGALTLGGLSGTRQGDAALTLGGRGGRWAYEGRLGGLRAGQLATPDGLVPNTAQEQATVSARVGYRLGDRGALAAEVGRFTNRLGLFEPDGSSGAGRYAIAQPNQRVQHDRAVLRTDVPVGPHRLDVVTALQQNRRREFSPEGGPDAPELSLRLTTGTADVRLHHAPVGPVFGTVGASGFVQRNETLAEETLIPGGTTLNGAVYVAEQVVFPTLTLDAGLRLDARALDVDETPDLGVAAQSRRYAALTGAVGAAWQPGGGLSLGANLGRAFRAPTLQELFGNGVHEGTLRFERGDADLTPETGLALDGVVRFLSPHVYAEVSAFVNALDGYVYPRPTGEADPESGFQVYDFDQADARLVGAEFRLDVHPHALHGLGLHLSGDVVGGTNRDTDQPLPFVPPARLRAAVEYRGDRLGPARDVEARVGPTFTAAQRRSELADEVPTAAYTVVDLSVSATFPLGPGLALTPVLAVDNLFDAAYVDPLSRYRPYGVLAPGQSARLSVRLAFGG